MSLCVEEFLTGCLTIVGTSCLEDEYYTKYTLPLGPLSLSITVLIWVGPSAFFSFALLWILGTTMYIKSQESLSTAGIWMIMPPVVQALNGHSLPKPYFKNSPKLVSSFSHIIVTPWNVFPNPPTKLLVFSLANLSPMASPLSELPFHPCSGPRTCAYARVHAVSSFTHRFSLFPPITCHEYPHILPFLHTAPCKCKCKTFLLPNFSLSSSHLSLLDSTPWGCKIISSSAAMLGLFLHSPQSQPTPLYDEQMTPLPLSPPFTRSAIEAAQLRKPIATMQKRTRACSALGLSFRDRTIFLSFYVLSLPVYHHSTLLPSSPFYRVYFTLIRRLLAPRHWIQASQLPGIVTYLRLGILHCPYIHLTCSLLGYCLRCYGEPVALWLCYVTPTLPPMPAQLREGLHTVRRLLLSANPYNPEPFIYPLQRYLHNDHSPYKLSRLVLSQVKIHLRHQLLHGARTFLRERLSQVDWAFSSSSFTLETLHATPLKAIPPFSRLAILRWIIDSELDVHFRLRPHFTRSSPCRCGCGKFSSLFPFGFQSGSVHHSHFAFPLTWTLLACPSLLSAFPHFFREQHPPLPPFTSPPVWYTRQGLETASLDTLPPPLIRWLSHPCILCGRGDNSVQHWLNFCPIPALAGSLLLNRPWRTRFWYFTRSHSLGHRSIIAAL